MSKFKGKVSIIIPNYNYGIYLDIAIKSAMNQTYKNIEIIVIDDFSTDNSREVINKYSNKVKTIFLDENKGHANAFNVGLRNSSGEIIFFLDADDFHYQNTVQTVVDNYKDTATMYHYMLDLVNPDGAVFGKYPTSFNMLSDGDQSYKLRVLGDVGTSVTTGLAFSRQCLDIVMPIDIDNFRYSGDGYLTSCVPLYGDVVRLKDTLGAYRQHGKNHSSFSHHLLNRANWSITHNRQRFKETMRHCSELGLKVDKNIGLYNFKLLEQYMIKYLLDSGNAVFNRRELLKFAFSKKSNLKGVILKLYWLSVTLLPVNISLKIITWKLNGGKRPYFLELLFKLLRSKNV